MINFFKQIRKQVLGQGKIGNYFKYAVGEIILVVIGILIALQINNWNERNKLKIEEQKLISAVIDEIESNLETLKISIKTNKRLVKGSSLFLQNASSTLNFEYDVSTFPQLFAYSSNKTESSIINEVLGTNSRALISNQKYIEQLRVLKRSYDKNEKTQFYVDEYWNTQIAQLFNDIGIGIYINLNGLFKNKKIDFKINDTFLSALSLMNGYQQSLLISREDLLKDLNSTLKILKNEIND